MKKILMVALALLVCVSMVSCWAAEAASTASPRPLWGKGIRPALLRCEYLEDPLGIQEGAPRLSWIVESSERGQSQTAYRVLVASSEDSLKHGKGDLWDSEKVQSDDTIAVVYAGKALISHQRCFWKVKVWDKDRQESAWSKPAQWSIGLLKPEDWKSEWIGFDRAREEALKKLPAPADPKNKPEFLPPVPYFRGGFRAEKPVARATLYVSALVLLC